MPEPEHERVARTRLGTVLNGKYHLDHVLGVGGMAVVYAATHRNSKVFAVKVLHPELSFHEAIRTRFLREGYLANQVKHPGAVSVLDDDVAEDGSAFVVMELLEGAPLDAIAAKGPLPLPLVLSIGDALLDVLVAAHARGIVHRDLKPGNVFLTCDGTLKVLDFGIARLREGTASHATLGGSLLGTPAFMAPEQALASGEIDAQTDLWGVGATLYSLLAGRTVHDGDNAPQVLVSAATRPARSLASVASGVPDPVVRVIDRALAFYKKDRWASASAMREALAQACVEVTGAPSAPLPKQPKSERTAAASTATLGPSGERSGRTAFAETLDASGERSAPRGAVHLTTGAGVAKGTTVRPRRLGRGWAGAAVVLAVAVAGGAAYRRARAPVVRYCAELTDTSDGPRCVRSIDAAIAKRRMWSARVTEIGGRVTLVEWLSFTGHPEGTRETVVRDDAGAVREIVFADRRGVTIERQRWSEAGHRVDLVEDDGVTPRHAEADSHATTILREFDARGYVARERYVGVTGRPRARTDTAGWGYQTPVFGRDAVFDAQGRRVRRTILAADGRPGAGTDGVASWKETDEPRSHDTYFLDVEGNPATSYGTWHRRDTRDDAFEEESHCFFGPRDEALPDLGTGYQCQRAHFDAAARTMVYSFRDTHDRPSLWSHGYNAAARWTFDDLGRIAICEPLDKNGNVATFFLPTESFGRLEYAFDALDERVEQRNVDAKGTPRFSTGLGGARQTYVHDDKGRVVETRTFDESGRPGSIQGGAVRKNVWDERGVLLAEEDYDAQGRRALRPSGAWALVRKYDRLRNKVEETALGLDGQPTMLAAGSAIDRFAYDENDDLVEESHYDAAGAPVMLKGEYFAKRFVNDERGLVVEERYLDVHNEPTLCKDGWASARYVRDRNGDVTQESFFGKRGEPVFRAGAYAVRKNRYDVGRRRVETSLFDASGSPVLGDDGWSIERETYDERGQLAREDHLGKDGAPILTKAGSASRVDLWDERGNLSEETALGTDGKPVVASGGFATKKSVYGDADKVVEEALFGADRSAVNGDDGWSIRKQRYDEQGNPIEEAWFDKDRKPVAAKGASWASVRSRFDSRQSLVETSWFDASDAPARGPDGAAAVRYQRDQYGRAVETAYFDGAGAPVASSAGKLAVRSTYDEAGRVIAERSVDAAGAPRLAADGCATRTTKYDPQGRKIEESCLDAKETPTIGAAGWALRRTVHDTRGNDVDVATYGPDGALVADKEGVARRRSRFDERNLVTETRFFDAADRPTHDKRGAHAVRYTYDDAGKKTGESAFDERDGPVKAKPQK
jgi:serine/threonine-protein kinase